MEKNLKLYNRYYSVYDKVANDFMPLFKANNDELAIRMLQDNVSKNPLHCEDIELYYICSFNNFYSYSETKKTKIAHCEFQDNKAVVVRDVIQVSVSYNEEEDV